MSDGALRLGGSVFRRTRFWVDTRNEWGTDTKSPVELEATERERLLAMLVLWILRHSTQGRGGLKLYVTDTHSPDKPFRCVLRRPD